MRPLISPSANQASPTHPRSAETLRVLPRASWGKLLLLLFRSRRRCCCLEPDSRRLLLFFAAVVRRCSNTNSRRSVGLQGRGLSPGLVAQSAAFRQRFLL